MRWRVVLHARRGAATGASGEAYGNFVVARLDSAYLTFFGLRMDQYAFVDGAMSAKEARKWACLGKTTHEPAWAGKLRATGMLAISSAKRLR